MTTEMAVTPIDSEQDTERKRKLTLLRAVGLDRVSPEQRELALAIAKRYDLDLLLKHLVLIDGKPYVTRDALLWIAHRSGQFDGMTVTKPIVEGDFWQCEATVWRKDMSHPFVYGGRYPVKPRSPKAPTEFLPEMAVKVAESMALRRAFNISAPTADERWDVDVPAAEPEPPKSLAEKVAEKAAAVQVLERTDDGFTAVIEIEPAPGQRTVDLETGEIGEVEEPVAPKDEPATTTAKPTTPTTASATDKLEALKAEAMRKATQSTPERLHEAAESVQCDSVSKLSNERCRREQGHGDLHRTTNEAWVTADAR